MTTYYSGPYDEALLDLERSMTPAVLRPGDRYQSVTACRCSSCKRMWAAPCTVTVGEYGTRSGMVNDYEGSRRCPSCRESTSVDGMDENEGGQMVSRAAIKTIRKLLDNVPLALSSKHEDGGPSLYRMDLLSSIIEAAELARSMEVDQARAAGASWTRIGQQLGMSKQAAQQRYGKRTATQRTDDLQTSIDIPSTNS